MSVRLRETRVRDVSVFELAGRVTLGEGARTFRQAVRDAVWEGRVKLALDYGEVSYTDSSGIGELLSAFTTVSNADGELVLVDLTTRVADLLKITKFYTVFRVFETAGKALEYFDASRAPDFTVVERDQSPVLVLQASGPLTEQAGAAKLVQVIGRHSSMPVAMLCPQILEVDAYGAGQLAISQEILGGSERFALVGAEDGLREKLATLSVAEQLALFPNLDAALTAFGVDVAKQYPWRKDRV
jgi:anti-sigma B factor antagonist